MRKLLKGFLIAAGVLLALAGLGVLAVNLYVQSAGTQKRLEHALTSGLKVPVHVTSTIVTPWSGLKASGITVPQASPRAGDFLDAASFTAHFDWGALLKHKLVASDVSLDQPQVEWFQSPDGRWELPRETPAPQASPEPEKAKGPAGPAWEITVHELTVNEASFDFWDAKGMRLLEFAGVQFDCLNPRSAGTEGHASCKNVSLHDRIFFHDMKTNWSFERGLLMLSSFETTVGDGQIRGNAQVATLAKHSPFKSDVSFDGVNMNKLMTESGQPADEVTGALKGRLEFTGNSGKTSSINGVCHLELDGGQLRNIELFQMLGQVLQIPDLIEMNLKTAVVDARVVSGVVNVDKLLFESQNLQLSAHGTVGMDGKLALNARLTVNGKISGRLPSFILTNFKPGDTADARYIDFAVGNTLSHPKTNLSENILGSRIQGEMGGLLQTLFGKKPGPAATPP